MRARHSASVSRSRRSIFSGFQASSFWGLPSGPGGGTRDLGVRKYSRPTAAVPTVTAWKATRYRSAR